MLDLIVWLCVGFGLLAGLVFALAVIATLRPLAKLLGKLFTMIE